MIVFFVVSFTAIFPVCFSLPFLRRNSGEGIKQEIDFREPYLYVLCFGIDLDIILGGMYRCYDALW